MGELCSLCGAAPLRSLSRAGYRGRSSWLVRLLETQRPHRIDRSRTAGWHKVRQQAHHDRVLALEVVVERRLREPERAGDVPDRGPFKALLGEQRDVRFDDVENRHPQIANLVGDGHMFASDGEGRAIIGQRNSNGHVRGYLAMRTDLDWHIKAGVDVGDATAVRRFLLEEFHGWSGELLPFITDSDGGLVNRPIYVLPAPFSWEHIPGATLLGDAAHLMSPFGGFGVNLALLVDRNAHFWSVP